MLRENYLLWMCFAPVYDNLGNEILEETCHFCRTPLYVSDEEYKERLQKRVEVGDAEAMFTLGCYYDEGRDGFPQDYEKALLNYLFGQGILVVPKLIPMLVMLMKMAKVSK